MLANGDPTCASSSELQLDVEGHGMLVLVIIKMPFKRAKRGRTVQGSHQVRDVGEAVESTERDFDDNEERRAAQQDQDRQQGGGLDGQEDHASGYRLGAEIAGDLDPLVRAVEAAVD